MITIQPQLDAARPKRRWFRFNWLKLLVLSLLLAASAYIGLAVWSRLFGFPPTWTTLDYDKQRYQQIRNAIASDPKHLLGKPFDEISKALSLEDVPWDDATFQEGWQHRMYHFRGFAFCIDIDRVLPADSPLRSGTYTEADLQKYGVVQLVHQYPALRIDGLNDRKERMRRFWKAIDEECDRINAEMDRKRRSQK